ncbi:hypothetical protein TNCV_1925361 [Trichonephila clavipes]|nr:hypothetical protein TNCV_1925361 [Trichonephila clavipes]
MKVDLRRWGIDINHNNYNTSYSDYQRRKHASSVMSPIIENSDTTGIRRVGRHGKQVQHMRSRHVYFHPDFEWANKTCLKRRCRCTSEFSVFVVRSRGTTATTYVYATMSTKVAIMSAMQTISIDSLISII